MVKLGFSYVFGSVLVAINIAAVNFLVLTIPFDSRPSFWTRAFIGLLSSSF